MDSVRKRFFWQGGNLKRKYDLVKWARITKPKNKSGLGVKDPRRMKWWWKAENGEGIWQDIIRKKYLKKGGHRSLKEKPQKLFCLE